jgi:hypothetical protein
MSSRLFSADFGKDNMFDLKQAVAEWRRQLRAGGFKSTNVLDELESHLREDLQRQMESGESAEQAFEAAVRRIGPANLLKCEFAKLGGKKWALLGKLKVMLAGRFVPEPSLDTFAPSALLTLELARTEAPRLNHHFIGTEHVLLGLLALEDGVVPNILKTMGVDRESLRKQIENWVSSFPFQKMPARLLYTPRVKKSLQLAAREAKASHHDCIGPEHIFLGLLLEGDGVAGRVLKNLGISSATTRKEILREQARSESGS